MRVVFTLLLFVFSHSTYGENTPVEHFAKKAQFKEIKLSPDGKHFAATVPKEKRTLLIVVDRTSNKQKIAYGFQENEHIGNFYWVNNERLVYTKKYRRNYQEKLITRGEVFAANIDGTKRVQLFGASSKKSKIASKKGLKATGKIAHILPDDAKHILVLAKKSGKDSDHPKKLYKVNVYNQKRSLITKTPHGNFSIVTDGFGNPVAGKGKDRQGKSHKYLYVDSQWQIIAKNHPLAPYSIKATNKIASIFYLSKSGKEGTDALYSYDTKTQQIDLLFNHDVVDINSIVRAPASKEIIAIETMFDGVDYFYIEDEHAFAKIHKQIAASFPGDDISIRANSMADNEMVIKITSDRNPGEYYLLDRKKQSLTYLISAKPWIKPKQMMPRKLVQFKARDNQTIYGYLTLPKDNGKPHPLLIDVHGGPYGVQDKWHYQTDAQLWASQGIAVLQINFRGSGGYGTHYEKTAYLKRDSLIQHDIIDGTRWAQSLDNISDDKVCIRGGSFGGYSALMSPLIEPSLYKCAIAMYGPYDLLYQMKNADYMGVDSVSVGAMEKYGDNEDIWKKQSPLTYVEKLATPILIVTGGKDKRVPPQSAHNLKAALDKLNKPYQWLYKPKEGHGFTKEENKIELYQTSLAFAKPYLFD